MKKALFFVLLLGGLLSANAANLSFLYANGVYHQNDTITMYVRQNVISFDELFFKNEGSNLNGVQVSLTLIENNVLEIKALCTGDNCVSGLTSAPFSIAAGQTYDAFSFDFKNGTANADGNYCLYKMELAGVTVYLRFVVGQPSGIDAVAANAQAVAYPNPAHGEVSIRYAVSQPAALVVYDAQGRQVRQVYVNGEGTSQLGNLPAGIYAYGFVTDDNRTTMRKLVVK